MNEDYFFPFYGTINFLKATSYRYRHRFKIKFFFLVTIFQKKKVTGFNFSKKKSNRRYF